MKLVSLIAATLTGTFLVAQLATASAFKQNQTVKLMNIDYALVTAHLDRTRFPANNVLISLTNVSDQTLTLKIMNDICPQIQGQPSCRAMPIPMFVGEFLLLDSKTDSCGTKTYTSNVVMENGEQAQLILNDFRAMTCEIVYVADLELTLKTETDSLKTLSTLLLNVKDITAMPVIQPVMPMPIQPHIPNGVQSFFTKSLLEKSGPFFEDHEGLKSNISLDDNTNTLELYTSYNPCAGQLCEAISAELINRTLDVTSVKSNKCNEKTYFTNEVSVYDAYPDVVGAIHTYVQVELLDTRHSICDQGPGGVFAFLTVTERQNLIQEVVVSESKATFELASLGSEK